MHGLLSGYGTQTGAVVAPPVHGQIDHVGNGAVLSCVGVGVETGVNAFLAEQGVLVVPDGVLGHPDQGDGGHGVAAVVDIGDVAGGAVGFFGVIVGV